MSRTSRTPSRITPCRMAVAAAAAVAFAAPAAVAQPRILGLTRITPQVLSQLTTTCAPATCLPAGLPPPAASFPWVGGTAYDSDTRGVWVSNGLLIAKVDPRSACAPECPVLPMPNTTPNNPVTGLAYYEPTRTLYVTDQSNTIRWYSVGGGCQLSLVSRCIAPIPAGDVLTGCATDDQTGQIFYCAVTPGNPGGRVYVAQIGSPCTPFCNFPITTCGTATMGPLVGLGYDACADVLWATDGRFTTGRSFNPIACALISEVQCCVNTGEPYVGLDVLANNETSAGASCTAAPCPACPTMLHVLGGDPYLGSISFSLDLNNAPGGSSAVLIINFGACGPPVFSPPLCAGVRVGFVPPPVTAFAPAGGTPGLCNGAATIGVPIPPNPALCGAPFCSQYIGFCPTGGTYVSNALGWSIGGS